MKAKKVLALTLSAVMVLGLAACGEAEPAEAPAATEEKTEAPAAEEKTEEPAADTAAEADSTADTAAAPAELSYTALNIADYADTAATIKFIHHKTDRAEDGTMDAMVAEFNKSFPNIKVEMEAVTDYAEDALLRLSTGDWGDIMFIPAIDKNQLETYFMPFDTLDNLSGVLNFANQ